MTCWTGSRSRSAPPPRSPRCATPRYRCSSDPPTLRSVSDETPQHGVTFREAARFWVKLGFINFGGPAGQIAIMHEEIVQRRRWITNGRFLHALNYCMLLPGPEAAQL